MMSSEISTSQVRPNPVRLKPDATEAGGVQRRADLDQGLQPWQFFLLAALGLATAVTFMVRGQGLIPVVMLSVLLASSALVGLAALRVLRPLVSNEEDRTPMIGERTRAALEREKMLALRAIKELDFDRAMGKVSESDWKEMSGRLRTRAARLIRQLDAGSGYRAQIERDVATRLESAAGRSKSARGDASRTDTRASSVVERVCTACSTSNDPDARFCKNCGQKL